MSGLSRYRRRPSLQAAVCADVIGIITALRERPGACRGGDTDRRGRERGWFGRSRVLSGRGRHGCRCWSCRRVSCPSHRAMTAVSTPACSSRMAAVWRSVCGVTVFLPREGQACAAVATCVARRCAMASRLSGRPVRVGKTGASGTPTRSVSHVRRAAAIGLVSGVIRCLRPFPRQLTCGPRARCRSTLLRPVSSETRRPVWTASARSV